MCIIISLLISLFLSCTGRRVAMNYTEIGTTHTITGSLGKPLGTILHIEGRISSEQLSKADAGKLICEVSVVDDKKLAEPVLIPLEIFEWVSGGIPGPGDRVQCIGYETGGMTGIPQEAFSHIPYVTATDYSFTLSFQVIKWRE
jgi:hypothetical protein